MASTQPELIADLLHMYKYPYRPVKRMLIKNDRNCLASHKIFINISYENLGTCNKTTYISFYEALTTNGRFEGMEKNGKDDL